MIGPADLFRKRHLGIDHLLRLRSWHSHARHEPLELESGRARHDHDSIAQGFTAGFIEKWNISKKKLRGVGMAFGFEPPLAADARMQDLLQRAFLLRVGEHYGTDRLPIQAPVLRINRRAKF